MEHEANTPPHETPHGRWQRRMAARPLPPVSTTWGMEVAPLYTPADVQSCEYERDLGYPGDFPFTRGVYPSMYRGRLWTFREYAGFGTAEDSNARYRALLDQGMTGLSVAFDLPTQIGFDSDDPRVGAEVGRVGVAIDSLADMELLFDGIPLPPHKLRAGGRLLLHMDDAAGLAERVRAREPERHRLLNVRPTTLEDVFLALTGARLEGGQ